MTTRQVEDERLALVDKALRRARYAQDELIELLHVAQDIYGSLSRDLLAHLARELKLPPSAVFGVATFYHLFTFDPPGDHSCTICTGTACFVKGADDLVEAVSTTFGVPAGQTSSDGRLTLTTGRCLGSCGLAPVVVLDGQVLAHQDIPTVLGELRALLAVGAPSPEEPGRAPAVTVVR